MAEAVVPLALVAAYEGPTEADEDAAAQGGPPACGHAVVTLNGRIEVARLRLAYRDWDCEPPEAMEQAVAEWLGGRK